SLWQHPWQQGVHFAALGKRMEPVGAQTRGRWLLACKSARLVLFARSRCRLKSHLFSISKTPIPSVFTRFFSRRNRRARPHHRNDDARSLNQSMQGRRNANNSSKVSVGTTHISMATIASAWFRRNVFQLCDGGLGGRTMYFETVDWATS